MSTQPQHATGCARRRQTGGKACRPYPWPTRAAKRSVLGPCHAGGDLGWGAGNLAEGHGNIPHGPQGSAPPRPLRRLGPARAAPRMAPGRRPAPPDDAKTRRPLLGHVCPLIRVVAHARSIRRGSVAVRPGVGWPHGVLLELPTLGVAVQLAASHHVAPPLHEGVPHRVGPANTNPVPLSRLIPPRSRPWPPQGPLRLCSSPMRGVFTCQKLLRERSLQLPCDGIGLHHHTTHKGHERGRQ